MRWSFDDGLGTLKCSDGGKPTVRIQVLLTDEQLTIIKEAYFVVKIECDPRIATTNGLLCASRSCEAEVLLAIARQFGWRFIDLGGNWVNHLKRERFDVHCCCPPLDAYDEARRLWHKHNMHEHVWYNPTRYSEAELYRLLPLCPISIPYIMSDNETPAVCRQLYQDCHVRGDVVIASHCICHLCLPELAQVMTNYGAKLCVGTFIFDPKILVCQVAE